MPKIDVEFETHKAHFGPISQGMIDFVTNSVLLYSRYLFTKSTMGIQYAYCTHCNEWHKPENNLKHNCKATCPKCASACTVKKSHVGRKYMRDFAYVVYYEKSIIDPKVMTAKGFYVKRDYSGDFKGVTTLYRPSCSYVFEMGKSTMFQTGYHEKEKWYRRDTVVSEYSFYSNGTDCTYSRESISEAVKGTPFQYSTWEKYRVGDMVKFFDLYSRYPCVEYLTKMGFRYFVDAKLFGRKTYSAINWNGKKIDKILKLNKQELHEVKAMNNEVDPLAFRLFQLTRKENNRLPLREIQNFTNSIGESMDYIKEVMNKAGLMNYTDVINYINRQYARKDKVVRYQRASQVLITWRDYLNDCKQLQIDISNERNAFPSNLFSAHQKSSARLSDKLNKASNAKLTQRIKELKKYCFEYKGFVIRPFTSVKEIVAEGNSLQICIGRNYSQSYVEGTTDLLCIRKSDDLETPFFSMEVYKGAIAQVQGFGHSLPDGELAEFIEVFKMEKLNKKHKSTKFEPIDRQGVAV